MDILNNSAVKKKYVLDAPIKMIEYDRPNEQNMYITGENT